MAATPGVNKQSHRKDSQQNSETGKKVMIAVAGSVRSTSFEFPLEIRLPVVHWISFIV